MENESGSGLIEPKKLPKPWKSSVERRDLHRELVFNQKTGKQVIGQKTELQRVLESKKISKSKLDRCSSGGEQNNNNHSNNKMMKGIGNIDGGGGGGGDGRGGGGGGRRGEDVGCGGGGGVGDELNRSGDDDIPEFLRIHNKILNK